MIENAWQWATSKGRVRTNPVHKEEEAKLILDDYFAENTENGEMNHLESSGQFEAGCTCQHS